MGDSPPDDPPLICLAELPGPGYDAEAVDDDRQIKRMGIFLAGSVSDQFAQAIDTALATVDGEILGNAVDGMKTSRPLLNRQAIPSVSVIVESRRSIPTRKCIQAIGAVYAVRTPEDQWNMAGPSVFKDVELRQDRYC